MMQELHYKGAVAVARSDIQIQSLKRISDVRLTSATLSLLLQI